VKPVGSQERLAHEAEVDRSYVGGLERQEENPTVDVLDRLASMLEVPIAEFFREPRKGRHRLSRCAETGGLDVDSTVSHSGVAAQQLRTIYSP
jgi:transcriptional regulator with XRE-family HTH domain